MHQNKGTIYRMNNQDPISPAKGSAGLIRPLDDRYLDFLTDESGLTGQAESISFPIDENQIQQIVTRLSKQRIPITIQGSRTGICGGCVPTGGHILNLSRMNRISDKIEQKPDHSTLLVEPGVTLSALQTYLSGTGLFWPVDPTETSATLGGIAANHSKGPGSHFYGPVSRYIRSIRIMDTTGETHLLKNRDQALCLGSEGMVGIILSLELILLPDPCEKWGVVFFFETDSQALSFCRDITNARKSDNETVESRVSAVEFMNHGLLESIRTYQTRAPHLASLPDRDSGLSSAVSIEIHGTGPAPVEAHLEKILEQALHWGSDPDTSWAFSGDRELTRLKTFYHAATEAVFFVSDQIRDPSLKKNRLRMEICCDKTSRVQDMARLNQEIEEIEIRTAVFGHAGQGIFQVYFLPRTPDEYQRAADWINRRMNSQNRPWLKTAPQYGIGKTGLYPPDTAVVKAKKKEVDRLKKRWDPDDIWNPSNMKPMKSTGDSL